LEKQNALLMEQLETKEQIFQRLKEEKHNIHQDYIKKEAEYRKLYAEHSSLVERYDTQQCTQCSKVSTDIVRALITVSAGGWP
jgi:hypothetical protein